MSKKAKKNTQFTKREDVKNLSSQKDDPLLEKHVIGVELLEAGESIGPPEPLREVPIRRESCHLTVTGSRRGRLDRGSQAAPRRGFVGERGRREGLGRGHGFHR